MELPQSTATSIATEQMDCESDVDDIPSGIIKVEEQIPIEVPTTESKNQDRFKIKTETTFVFFFPIR